MKKSYLFLASAAMILAGCADESYNGNSSGIRGNNGEIAFSSRSATVTRADFLGAQAAEKLNGNFIVYGFKYSSAEDLTTASNDQVVFDLYNVNYEAGTANTTQSNTANWEYVGYTPHTGSSASEQTIKYWDWGADGYVFSAVSGTGITAAKTTTGSTVYDKGWNITIPQGGSLSDLYASERVPVVNKVYAVDGVGGFGNQVNLKFYNLGAKIRFAFYEVVPGYSIQIDKFYYGTGATQTSGSTTNFGVDGNFTTLKKDGDSQLKVTYYDGAGSTIVNRPKVSYEASGVSTATSGEFGANIQPTEAIGTTSMDATYDQGDKSYTDIIPMQGNGLTLKVDYTLTSTDGSKEKIHVYGATAKVPVNFTDWKENFAYTYLFKISDNTNGSTSTTPDTPEGLYPITFDAVVIGNEEGIQETITSVSNPSITTYQKGIIATEHNEYVAGDDIYFEDGDANVSGYRVYEVDNYGIEATTEEVVNNWKNNFCVLTEVAVTYAPGNGDAAADFIPLSDGTFIQKKANQAAKFTPVAGKTYVIANNSVTSATQWKVVKVEGTPSNRDYTLTQATNGSDVIADWTDATAHSVHYQMLSDNTATDKGAFGAKSLIKVYNAGGDDVSTNFDIDATAIASIYSIKPNMAALAAGKIANGDYTVKAVSDKDGSVIATGSATFNINYAVAANTVTIVAGKNADITPTIGGATITKATITGVPTGITIEETATAGTYNVKVAPTVANGDYDITFAGKTVTVTVDSYAFYNVPEFTFNYLGTDAAKTLNLRKNFGDADVEVAAMTLPSGYESIATITKATAGAYTVVPVGPGTFTVEYENTSATIVVNQYTLTPSVASIAKSTGSTNLTLKKNNGTTKTVNASTAKVTVKKDASVVTSGFSLTTNGQALKFGNVTTAGTYTFEYTENAKVVAVATVTVTE